MGVKAEPAPTALSLITQSKSRTPASSALSTSRAEIIHLLPKEEAVLASDPSEERHPQQGLSAKEFADTDRLSNDELLGVLDLVLLELERRLYRYARVGAELQEMADEGLLLAARSAARLGQAQSAAAHTQGHLHIVGVGSWKPTSTRPSWSEDPRVVEDEEQ